MLKLRHKLFSGFTGTLLMTVFIVGLAESISSGAAGFWGGLPFWVISVFCLALAWYDCWDNCIRKN